MASVRIHWLIPRWLPLIAGLLCAPLASAQASASGTAGSLKGLNDPMPDFPPGSINSVARSHQAEQAAAIATKRQEARYAEQRKACYKDFFAERCLSTVRDEDYQLRSRISGVELEARDFRRRDDAERTAKARDEREARRQAGEAQDRAEREKKAAAQGKKVEGNARENADFNAKAGERAKTAAEANKREADRRAGLKEKQDEEQARAPERAARAKERQAEVDEILKHAAEREARQKEKERARREQKDKQQG
jgi:hypothetical protein